MASFLVYLLSTGVIDRTGSTPDGDEPMQVQAGEGLLVGQDQSVTGATHYVAIGPPPVLTAKAAMGVTINKTFINASGSDIATISNVPPGAAAYVGGVLSNGNIADGSVEFTAATMGIYVIRIDHVQYLSQEFLVAAGVIEAPLIAAADRLLPTCCSPPPIRDTVTFLPTS